MGKKIVKQQWEQGQQKKRVLVEEARSLWVGKVVKYRYYQLHSGFPSCVVVALITDDGRVVLQNEMGERWRFQYIGGLSLLRDCRLISEA